MSKQNCNLSRTKNAISARRLTQDEFIRRCIEKHGDAYDYSLVDFKGTQKKVTIICNNCKKQIEQLATNHVRGAKCFHCYGKVRLSNTGFIEKSKAVHADRYSYSLVDYKNNKTKVKIVCKEHGGFMQRPYDHFQGKGCPDCAQELRTKKGTMTFGAYAERCNIKHSSKYEYDEKTYTKTDSLISIKCPKHGWFEQNAKAHLHGKGCRQCGHESGGYNRTRFKVVCDKNNNGKGYFYLIECSSETELFYKVGITSRHIKDRYKTKIQLPYDFKVIFLIEGSPSYIFNLENRMHSLLKKHHYTPRLDFKGGVYECFTTIKPIEKLLKELSTTDQLQLLA